MDDLNCTLDRVPEDSVLLLFVTYSSLTDCNDILLQNKKAAKKTT